MHNRASLCFSISRDTLFRDKVKEDLIIQLVLLLGVSIEKCIIEISELLLRYFLEIFNIESGVSISILAYKLFIVSEKFKQNFVELISDAINSLHGHKLIDIVPLVSKQSLHFRE